MPGRPPPDFPHTSSRTTSTRTPTPSDCRAHRVRQRRGARRAAARRRLGAGTQQRRTRRFDLLVVAGTAPLGPADGRLPGRVHIGETIHSHHSASTPDAATRWTSDPGRRLRQAAPPTSPSAGAAQRGDRYRRAAARGSCRSDRRQGGRHELPDDPAAPLSWQRRPVGPAVHLPDPTLYGLARPEPQVLLRPNSHPVRRAPLWLKSVMWTPEGQQCPARRVGRPLGGRHDGRLRRHRLRDRLQPDLPLSSTLRSSPPDETGSTSTSGIPSPDRASSPASPRRHPVPTRGGQAIAAYAVGGVRPAPVDALDPRRRRALTGHMLDRPRHTHQPTTSSTSTRCAPRSCLPGGGAFGSRASRRFAGRAS